MAACNLVRGAARLYRAESEWTARLDGYPRMCARIWRTRNTGLRASWVVSCASTLSSQALIAGRRPQNTSPMSVSMSGFLIHEIFLARMLSLFNAGSISYFVLATIASMNSKHTQTLQAVFAKPTAKTLEWTRIESLLIGVGCTLIEGNGSRVKFAHGTKIASFHRPHPAKEAKAYQVDDARAFLTLIGVTP